MKLISAVTFTKCLTFILLLKTVVKKKIKKNLIRAKLFLLTKEGMKYITWLTCHIRVFCLMMSFGHFTPENIHKFHWIRVVQVVVR